LPGCSSAAPAAHHAGEDILETRRGTRLVVETEMELPGAGLASATKAAETRTEGMALLKASLARVEAPGIAVRADGAGVELGAFILVAQDVIRPRNLLEFLLRGRIPRMLVGVVFLASDRKAFLISASLAVLGTPRTSYGSFMDVFRGIRL